MKMNKKEYVAPQVEVIEMETEAYCGSFGTGAADDAGSMPDIQKNSYFNQASPFLGDEE